MEADETVAVTKLSNARKIDETAAVRRANMWDLLVLRQIPSS